VINVRSAFLAVTAIGIASVVATGMVRRERAPMSLQTSASGGGSQTAGVQLPVPAPVPVADLTFADALTEARSLPRLRSLLVSVDGQLLLEHYFAGATAARTANIKSVSKSIIATLVGIAIDRGAIPGVREPIGRYFPQYLARDPAKAAITIEDLITMRSGLETTSNRNYGRWVLSGNWVRHALEQPMVDTPGGRMIYSTGSTHLLSAILTRATGTSTLAFARTALGQPLGIQIAPWIRDPQGIYLGGNEMAMRPRDMLRVGELYLNDGRYAGRQVVSEAWVRTSMEPRTVSRWSEREYGYGWWIRTLAGHPVFYAWGYGGQFIFIVPSTRTVIVTTSVSEPGTERREHLGAIYDLVERHIIPVAATAFPQAPQPID
jgi:CubicO group peptidase (beta-lactamase class C family)